MTSQIVEASQTGELSSQLELKLDVVDVEEPEPVPVDPTGGIRADNETGMLFIIISEEIPLLLYFSLKTNFLRQRIRDLKIQFCIPSNDI